MNYTRPIWFAAVLWLVSCESWRIGDEGRIVADAAGYVGKVVTICGYFHNAFEDNQVWLSRSSYRRGEKAILGLHSSNLSLHDRQTCLRGEIERSGCGEEVICLWSQAPFALRDISE